VHVAHERHVELDDLGLEKREAGEARVSCAEIVDRDLKPDRAKLGYAGRDILDLVERRALGDLEHDATGDLGKRRFRRRQRGIEQIARVQVDEKEARIGVVLHRHGRGSANGAAELGKSIEPLGGVEDRAGMGQRRLLAAQEGLVSEESMIACPHDGLVRHPQGVDGALEACFESGAVTGQRLVGAE